ncbi:thioredoxin family protein [Bacillus sp. V3B]|uniref:thioredoxin family protein n=1 Tax=Bacillus sp. V3B TaxID=2804915 RepID=UPI00210EBE41|nr:thioredoxin family protein [Bacillus sp. V3B]MCQ6277037.1 thioredoxin family protein [Bacillus sp. V3B]
MELVQWFEKGLTKEDYMSGMKVNKDGMDTIYNGFTLNNQEKKQLEGVKDKGLKVIALSEDWCGDAMLNNPILLTIAEEANIEVRFLLRDQNLELMDQYLTNGTARSIPIYIFMDQNGEEKAVWGPRAEKIQELVMRERSQLPDQERPEFKEKQIQLYKQLGARYQQDEEIWHTVAESILSVLPKE